MDVNGRSCRIPSQLWLPSPVTGEQNLVVPECKINNDASVDISADGQFLVAFLCVSSRGRQFVGVYSLRWESLGQVLYRQSFDQVPVSVSLSPTASHLLIGLASRRPPFHYQPAQAQVFRLEGARPGRVIGAMGRLLRVCNLKLGTDRRPEGDSVSLNCIRWSVVAGQGLAFGTNTGQLTLLRWFHLNLLISICDCLFYANEWFLYVVLLCTSVPSRYLLTVQVQDNCKYLFNKKENGRNLFFFYCWDDVFMNFFMTHINYSSTST